MNNDAFTGEPLLADDPARIGDYTVHARLGRGGEGRVYLASAAHTGPVALKLRTPVRDAAHLDYRDEFALARRLPAGVTARPIEHGVTDAGPYLVTEMLAGFTPVGPIRSARGLWHLAAATADALAATHAAGVIHCDVKPANVLVRGGDLRLVDFGIARDVDRQPTGDRIVHCSRGWGAPEQLRTGALTPAVDTFSWGCLVAYAATGASPFVSRTEEEWIVRVRMTAPDLDGLPHRLVPLVRVALDRDPAVRPSPAELAEECRRRSRPRPGRSEPAPASLLVDTRPLAA